MAADNDNNLVLTVSSDMTAAQRGIKKFVGDIAAGSAQIEKQFDKMGRGIDNSMVTAMQTRIDKMVGIGTQGAKEWTGALADQGKELERLRARYSPLFATINNYKSAVGDIRRAHALGAISATEMTAAISKERQAALASTAAIKGRNAALADTPTARSGGGSFNTANLAAQFQDIGVTAAMGMSPLQIALQQGTQISAVLGPMGAAGAVKSLGAAFLSVINPVSLVTIGLVAASAAAIQYFGSMDWGGEKSEETLKKEAELIDAVTQKWGEALPALKAYNDARKALAEGADVKAASEGEAEKQWTDLRSTIKELRVEFADFSSLMSDAGAKMDWVDPVEKAFNKLVVGVQDGTASAEEAKRVQDALMTLFKETGVPVVKEFADQIGGLADGLDAASGSASKLLSQGDKLAETLRVMNILNSGANGSDGVQDARLRDQLRRDAENKNPTVANPQGVTVAIPTPGQKPVQLGEEVEKSSQKAETAAQRAKRAYDDLIKSADDRIGQLRLETELTGEYGAATDAARFRLDLLQQSEDKGRSLSEAQKAQIEEKVAAYSKYSEALAQAKLQQDLLDASAMRGLSSQDQQVKQALRQYGLPEDLGGKNAGDIRRQLQLDEITSASDAFIDNLTGALLSGGEDIGKKLGQVVLNALLDSAQTQISGILKQVFGALMSGVTGGSVASPVGAVASAASSFAAPVGAVTRSALPGAGNIGAYAKAIQAIESGGSYGALGPVTRNGDRAYGAYQVMGNNIGPWSKEALGRSLSPSAFLADRGAQDAIFAHKFGGYAEKYGAPGAAQAWFGGPGSVGKGGMGADILGTTGNKYVEKFNAQIAKMGDTAASTVGGLGQLNSGLTAISQNFGGGAGLGGGFDFGSLFSSSWKPNTTLSAFLGVGANAKGTNSWSGGPTWVGEDGPEIINAPKGAQIIPNHAIRRVQAPVAPRLNTRRASSQSSNGPSMLTVQINGASGDPHVRELVRQGVSEALSAKNDNDRRGGFGTTQQRYNSQKV